MACQRPLLVLSGENTPIVNFLHGIGCAKLITEQDFDLKVNQMAEWLCKVTKEELVNMGLKGLDTIRQNYTKGSVTDMYVDLIDSII